MKTLRFLTVLLLLCCMPLCAFAMDTGFNGNTFWWISKTNVVYIPLDSLFDDDSSICRYYSDVENNCFYMHLSYNAEGLMDDGNFVLLQFNIKNNSHEYQYNVDENTGTYSDKTFEILSKFYTPSTLGQEIYVGIKFLNKDDKRLNTTLEISLHVNDSVYPILDDIQLNFGDYAESLIIAKPAETEQTTTEPTTKQTAEATTKKATEKSTAEKSTAESTATTKPSTEKTTAESTTKFKYTGPVTSPATTEKNTSAAAGTTVNNTTTTERKYIYEGNTTGAAKQSEATQTETAQPDVAQTENAQTENVQTENLQTENDVVIIPAMQSTQSLSPRAKLLTALAVVFAAAGSAIIIRSVSKKEKANANEEEQ